MPFDPEEARQAVREADVVIGVNTSGNGSPTDELVFYGRSLLQLIAGGYEGPTGLPLNVLRVPIDFENDDVEVLAALCLVEKGHHDLEKAGSTPCQLGDDE